MRSTGPDPAWRTDTTVIRAFEVATLTFAVVFAARFVVQQWLYNASFTGWLAVARIAMGYPLLCVGLAVAYWAVRLANRQRAVTDKSNERGPLNDGVGYGRCNRRSAVADATSEVGRSARTSRPRTSAVPIPVPMATRQLADGSRDPGETCTDDPTTFTT